VCPLGAPCASYHSITKPEKNTKKKNADVMKDPALFPKKKKDHPDAMSLKQEKKQYKSKKRKKKKEKRKTSIFRPSVLVIGVIFQ
jgi:hypothetical protein